MRSSVRTLRLVAERLAAVPDRRKVLVYISYGIPVDYGDVQTAQLGAQSGVFHDILRLEMQGVFREAQLANVAVYTYNPAGLAVLPRYRRMEMLQMTLRGDYLETLASSTGGFAVANVNNPQASVRRMFEENSAYYLVGYEPVDPPEAGQFRSIAVRVDRPGVTVRTRAGYFTPKAVAASVEVTRDEAALREALAGLVPVGELPMRIHVAPFPISGSDQTALVITAGLQQPAPDLPTEQAVELVAMAFDDRGRSRGFSRQRATLRLRPVRGAARYEVVTRLDLEPGRYEIRLAAHTSTLNLSGSVFHQVDVPDFARNGVKLSGVLLSTSPARHAEPRDALIDLVPVIPTTLREFSRNHQASALVRVHQGGRGTLADVNVNVSVRGPADSPVLDEDRSLPAGQFSKDRVADLVVGLPLATLVPGDYLLSISIGGEDEDAAVRRVRFTVR
jgi:hypothetical protein